MFSLQLYTNTTISCDCVEYYHKIHLCWLEDSGCYVYDVAKTGGGFPR